MLFCHFAICSFVSLFMMSFGIGMVFVCLYVVSLSVLVCLLLFDACVLLADVHCVMSASESFLRIIFGYRSFTLSRCFVCGVLFLGVRCHFAISFCVSLFIVNSGFV